MAALPASAGLPQVSLIGCGPGDRELMTLKGLKAVQTADVCMYDALIGKDVLEWAKPTALKIEVGKRKGYHIKNQGQINDLLVQHAAAGRTVARLKGGDPNVFGRVSEEAEVLRKHGISYQIVPGVTAASAAASALKCSLTSRGRARNLIFATAVSRTGALLTSWSDMLKANDSTVAVYMGLSVAPELCAVLQGKGVPKSTPAMAVLNASLPSQLAVKGTVGCLGRKLSALNMKDVNPGGEDAKGILIFGSVVGACQSGAAEKCNGKGTVAGASGQCRS